MAKGKHTAEHAGRYALKPLALMLALVMLVGGMIGGTVAWLIATPEPVVNTFTYGDINITLEETDTQDGDNNPNTNEYKMLPGQTITKDPVITVKAESEAMWLFVKLEKSSNFDDFMEYAVAEGWTSLDGVDGVDGVYYQDIEAKDIASADKEITVIQNNTVTVKDIVTKEQLNALDSGSTVTYPTLTVTAYAVQRVGNDTAALAWEKIAAAAIQ